ncbi:eukaryotic translation initiation factor 2-alpha kinase [Savitreella phatthalungensis]
MDYEEVQHNEIAALQSIFAHEFRILASSTVAWSKRPDPVFEIDISSSDDGAAAARNAPRVTLHVKLPKTYPKSAPELDIHGAKNVTSDRVAILLALARSQCRLQLGSEMLYDVVMAVKDELTNIARRIEVPSLEQERAQRLAQQQALKEAADAERALRHLQEDKARQEKIELERQDARPQSSRPAGPVKVQPFEDGRELISFAIPGVIDGKIAFDSVALGPKLSSIDRPGGTAVLLTELPQVGSLVVKLTDLPTNASPSSRHTLEGLLRSSIAADRNRRETHIVSFAYTLRSVDSLGWQLVVVQEFCPGGSLADVISSVGSFSLDTARANFRDVCHALLPEHRRGVAHGAIRPNKLLYKQVGNRRRLHLADGQSAAFVDHLWSRAPVASVSQDITALGTLLVTMLTGSADTDLEALRSRLPVEVHRLVSSCWSDRRPSVADLLATDFMRASDAGTAIPNPIQPRITLQRFSSSATDAVRSGRYLADFEEVSKLGQGGFGVVVKARNRLDGRAYAVKKIRRFREEKVLREVSGLARLDSPHIVRYFSAWIEDDDHPQSARSIEAFEVQDTDTDTDAESYPRLEYDDDEDSDIVFGDDLSESHHDFMSTSAIIPKETATASRRQGRQTSRIPSNIDRCTADGSRPSDTRLRTLYIQMELCDSLTLKSWLELTDNRSPAKYWPIFYQIVSGVRYLHGQHLIHRDLKPANIFIDTNGDVKLGDFGLAADMGDFVVVPTDETEHEHRTAQLSSAVGTALYMAPELVSGKGSYDAKVDMYALGVIFAELVHPWSTGMERVTILMEVRRQQPSFTRLSALRFAKELEILRVLLDHDPRARPSAEQLQALLPPIIDEERLSEALKLYSRGQSHTKDIIRRLFTRIEQDSVIEHVYEAAANTATTDQAAQRTRWRIVSALARVFARHGATRRVEPLVVPASTLYDDLNAVRVVDSSGHLLQLSYDLRLSWCRSESSIPADAMPRRSFAIGTVARGTPDGLQPRYLLEADFDMSFANSPESVDRSGELLRVLQEIDDEVSSLDKVQPVIALGHVGVTRTLLACCGIDDRLYRSIAPLLGSWQAANPAYHASVTKRLIAAGLSETHAADSLTIAAATAEHFHDKLDVQLKVFGELCRGKWSVDVDAHLRLLQDFATASAGYNVRLPLRFAPFTLDLYMYDLMVKLDYSQNGRWETVALGGSYTSMVKRCAAPGAQVSSARQYWGVSMAVDKLMQVARPLGASTRGALDVLVFAPHATAPPIDVLELLWESNIATDAIDTLQPAEDERRGARYLVTPRDRRLPAQRLKVRNLETRAVHEIPQAELASWISGELNRRL